MVLTLADVLRLEPMRRGKPRVVAGADRLGGVVRWVHVAEVVDLAHLLRGGELVLTTGIGLPAEPHLLRKYVADLAAVGVSGVAVELGHRFQRDVPGALVAAAEEHGIPLIVLERETPFVEITESVHGQIIDAQLEELRASEQLHEVFTDLSVEGAPPDDVLAQVAGLAGRPVVLENLAHQVLACDAAGRDTGKLLATWETRSRSVTPHGRTGYDETAGWLVTVVGARGQDWGRLILICDPDDAASGPTPRHTVLLERAATTLALGRLLERHEEGLERQTHRTIITGILAHAYSDPEEAAVRARAVGVPLTGRRLLGIVVRTRDTGTGLAAQARLSEVAETTAAAIRAARSTALVGSLDDVRVGVLLTLATRTSVEATLDALAERLRSRLGTDVVIGVGSEVDSIRDVRRSFLEARQVADVAAGRPDGRGYYRLPDLRLRGLLHLLRDDERLQTFVERELGPLLRYDAQHDSELTRALGAYLDSGRNKAVAARRSHLSRPAFYERLKRISRILGADLDDVESCVSLHVALVALEYVRQPPP
ncbi:MAG: PucR family transcriptional regulator [Streptosporangiales bacterium]|nr:PucR family transcriptional regulator [Streptosporangiales bacterium]